MLLSCGTSGVPNGKGVVTGGIMPCEGIVIPNGPHYAAGAVTVLKGQVTWKSTGQGTSVAVFPTTVVAQESVAMNATYRFALEPGQYVLEAQFPPPSNALPFTGVTLRAGDNLSVDIPNMCI